MLTLLQPSFEVSISENAMHEDFIEVILSARLIDYSID